ncbi:hypothetical protein PG996_008938 [Apiospora saccharicola]|uniref:Cation efflux protein transmembrane domain-containing protein n=1 Tax=Apiospora saccharicola TaxID=335842 RepID=A0ABR1UZD8_9PEZI
MSDPIQPVGPPAAVNSSDSITHNSNNSANDAATVVASPTSDAKVDNGSSQQVPSHAPPSPGALEFGNGLVDPLDIGRHRRDDVTLKQLQIEYPKANKRELRKFYRNQNKLINHYLGVDDEERMQVEEDARLAPKIKFAINASFTVNFCLFVIQLYAAVSTGSLALFATAADAFMDLVSSCVMLITSRMAARASIYEYPVGRTRIETMGIIIFCALMTCVAIELLIESGRTLGNGAKEASEQLHVVPMVCVCVAIAAKTTLMLYCWAYRKHPSVHVFFVDHRNDIAVNTFGLIMAVVGERFVWYLDPIGAICIALLILFSWVSNAFEQVWLLVGKTAPPDYISRLIYLTITFDDRILKVDTCRAYHAGQNYYVEVDIIMDRYTPLEISHDVSQALQRKLEGLSDVERAFVHVDYEDDHDINEEHKPLYEKRVPRRTVRKLWADMIGRGD